MTKKQMRWYILSLAIFCYAFLSAKSQTLNPYYWDKVDVWIIATLFVLWSLITTNLTTYRKKP